MDYPLTPDQEEMIVNFQAITENWDYTFALNILMQNNWDLQQATTHAMLISESMQYSEPVSEPYFNRVPAQIIPPNPVPVIRTQVQNNESTDKKGGFFSKFKTFISEIITTPVPLYSQAAESFQKSVNSIQSEYHANFSSRMLKDALQEAKQTKKMLMMYIHSDASIDYVKAVFCNDIASMIINQYYIAWGVYRESPDGAVAEQVLKATAFPCLAVVKVDDPAMPIVIEKIEGIYSSEKVIEFLSRNYIARPIVTEKERRFEEERKLRAKQDRELKEAERILKLRQLEDDKIKKEVELKIREENLKKSKEEERKKQLATDIGDEPTSGEITVISFRLPNGNKLERKFAKEKPVKTLYDFMELNGQQEIEILYGFPAAVLTDMLQTLYGAGLYPKALVIVRNMNNKL